MVKKSDKIEYKYILVPGRGRGPDGDSLSSMAAARAVEAARIFKQTSVAEKGGYIITSGYKSPADKSGEPDTFLRGYVGTPEADLLKDVIVAAGVPGQYVRVERDSIDTVTNFAFVEMKSFFQDDGAVAIVAQRAHLTRMLSIIAPRTLRRKYVGIVVEEQSKEDMDPLWTKLFSRLVLWGVRPDKPYSADRLFKRSTVLWKIVNFVRGNSPYKQE